ncbi:MAG TPA: nicotinamide-nucleotide amidohydrolase family protein [Jatrophihabitans sp.]
MSIDELSTGELSTGELVAGALLERGLSIATCESCTGGLVAGRLTDRPGSSAYVLGGLVTYSDEAKAALAKVPAGLIAEHGAVSAQVAEAMARGARTALGADIAISTTGIAGPGGGSPEKPVGLVYLGVVGPGPDGSETCLIRKVNLDGDRAAIRARTVDIALALILELLS